MSYNPNSGSGSLTIGAAVSGGTAGNILYVDQSGNLQQNAPNKISSTITYDPANFYPSYVTKKFWLKFYDSSKILDASDNPCVNNSRVKTVLDSDGITTMFAQATAGDRPTFFTNVLNGFSAVQFSNQKLLSSISSFLKNQTYISYGAVLYSDNAGTGTNYIFGETDNTNTHYRLLYDLENSTNHRVIIQGDDSQAQVSVPLNAGITTNKAIAVLIEWNLYSRVLSFYVNNVTSVIHSTNEYAASATGVVTNSNAGSIHMGVTSDCSFIILESFLFVNGLMTDWQRDQYFKAVQSKYNLNYNYP